jgi:hypothetical protein
MCCLVERTQIADIDIYDLWNCLDEIQIMRAFALIATLVGYLVDFIYGHSANDYRAWLDTKLRNVPLCNFLYAHRKTNKAIHSSAFLVAN